MTVGREAFPFEVIPLFKGHVYLQVTFLIFPGHCHPFSEGEGFAKKNVYFFLRPLKSLPPTWRLISLNLIFVALRLNRRLHILNLQYTIPPLSPTQTLLTTNILHPYKSDTLQKKTSLLITSVMFVYFPLIKTILTFQGSIRILILIRFQSL